MVAKCDITTMLYPNIEAERARCGYTYDKLSSLLSVSRKTLYTWLTQGKIPQSKLEELADIFNTTTDYLLATSSEENQTTA